jgi:hypothetical protein
VFTARYALSPYIKQTRFVFKGLNVKWLDKIPNEELWQRKKQALIEKEIKERKWRWIGHPLCKPQDAIERHALVWKPQGTRRRVRPRITWKRTVKRELQNVGIGTKGKEKIMYYSRHRRGPRCRSWLRHCATSRQVAGSIPDGAIGFFHWHNPVGRTMALVLGST